MRTRTRLVGNGPCEASPHVGVERQPFCWDTNGFYRALGVPVDAPRIDIARAYLALDGYLSLRLTTAARVLLDRSLRRAYDAVPLGMLFGDDPALHRAVVDDRIEVADPRAGRWAAYVSGFSDDAVVDALDPGWWSLVGWFLHLAGHPRPFALGVAVDGGVQRVGGRDVVFVPLAIASACDPDYAFRQASALIALR